MTTRTATILIVLAAMLAGCSGSATSLSTGSLFGGSSSSETTQIDPAAAAIAAEGTPTSRAFQVGSVAARAVKCGYNFDAPTLKTNFLAAEVARGTTPELIARAEKIYTVAYNGVWKGVAAQESYCSAKRTKQIQTDLRRHLAGDYTPKQHAVIKAEPKSSGFASWFSSQP